MSDNDLFGGGRGSADKTDHGTRVIQTRVVDNCDNARLGRVMVQVPWLEGPVVAAVATLAAGKDRGTFFTPQKDDEVLVLIKEKPDLTAYVIGAVHTSQDTPPDRARQSSSPRVQLIRTPGGHEVIFDDDSGELIINASGGQTVSLSKDGVEIRGSKPAEKLQDDAVVTLGSKGDVTISGRSITLEADSIDIKATSGDCNINATGGACNIKGGPKVNIN
jgi:phage baseplate assembly protein gpV